MVKREFKDSASFGKRMEYSIIGELLLQKYDVYIPLVDDHGVDAIIKKKDGTFIELQIKARSNDVKNIATFANINVKNQINDKNNNNFYFIFRSEKLNKTWVLSFNEFIENSKENKTGKNKGNRTIIFSTKNGKLNEKLKNFEVKNFDKFS